MFTLLWGKDKLDEVLTPVDREEGILLRNGVCIRLESEAQVLRVLTALGQQQALHWFKQLLLTKSWYITTSGVYIRRPNSATAT
eukprot:SAG11_NODE_9447_length_910_cov_2.023428_1_plen_84_part_00